MGEACLGEIFKARCDQRDYRSLLLCNGMQVLLVSDPETDKAAASMDVKVGSFSDPDDLPGLAHFLEHMLFYASEKYPLEDEFIKFVTMCGGSTNAFTASEHTNFHFEVNYDHLSEALERFAQFFICPLMSENATQREMNAVDSEHALGRSRDSWRLDQLLRSVTSSGHPYHKFGTGNLETLNSKGNDTRKEMIRFYEKYYSANVMCLVVYGRECLDELQNLVSGTFSMVINRDIKRPYFLGEPCLPEHLQIFITAVPVKDRHVLEFQWPVIPDYQHYKASPCYYISDLLGHEADGSILSLLKHRAWATSLGAWEESGNMEYSFFRLQVELTDAGSEHVDEIISMIFSYIKLVKEHGVTPEYFDELKNICEMHFQFQDKYAPFSYVVHLTSQMQMFPVEDWLVGKALPREFNPDLIKRELDFLAPERVRVIFSSKKFDGKTTATEPWYGTAYSLERISDQAIADWQGKPADKRLHLPKQNMFIPRDFSLQTSKKTLPTVLKWSDAFTLWFKPDHAFERPKGCFRLNMHCPKAHCSPESVTLSNLFVRLLYDDLNEFAYYAEIAGLWYSISFFMSGFQIRVSGYNHKLGKLLECILSRIADFKVKEERFSVIKEKYIRDIRNHCFDNTQSQASYYCRLLLIDGGYHGNDYLEAASSLDWNDLQSFIPDVLSRMSAESYVAGNFTPTEAHELGEVFEKFMFEVKSRTMLPSLVRDRRVVNLEPDSDFYFSTHAMNPDDDNSTLLNYFQIGRGGTRLNVLGDLFAAVAYEAAFKQLRTVEQLGYNVSLTVKDDWGVRAVRIIIQSKVKDPNFLDERAEAFLLLLETQLKDMTDAEFQKYVNGMIGDKLEKHKNLWGETTFYWSEIEDQTFQFERPQTEVAAVKDLKQQDLIRFFEDYIKRGGQMRRKLSIRVFGKLHRLELPHLEDSRCIRDIFMFRRSQALYSSLHQSIPAEYKVHGCD